MCRGRTGRAWTPPPAGRPRRMHSPAGRERRKKIVAIPGHALAAAARRHVVLPRVCGVCVTPRRCPGSGADSVRWTQSTHWTATGARAPTARGRGTGRWGTAPRLGATTRTSGLCEHLGTPRGAARGPGMGRSGCVRPTPSVWSGIERTSTAPAAGGPPQRRSWRLWRTPSECGRGTPGSRTTR